MYDGDGQNLPRLMYDDDRPPPRVRTEIKLVLTIFISLIFASYLTNYLNSTTETPHEPTTPTLATRAC